MIRYPDLSRQCLEVDRRLCRGRQVDDARARLQQWQESLRQQAGCKRVDRKPYVETVIGERVGAVEYAGVVDYDIDFLIVRNERFAERDDVGHAREVGQASFGLPVVR